MVNIFNTQFMRLSFFTLSCLMMLTPVHSEGSLVTKAKTTIDNSFQKTRDKGYRKAQGNTQANFQTLYTFSEGDAAPANPSNLIQATDGNFYGTTYFGGTKNVGTLFRFTPGQTLSKLHDFATETDGSNPRRQGLLQSQQVGSSLLFYGATTNGGANGSGGTLYIYESSNGTFKTVVSFKLDPNQPPVSHSNIVEMTAGVFVGTTDTGGTDNKGSLYGYIPNQLLGEDIYSFHGPDGAGPPSGLPLVSDKKFVYGITVIGGANNLNLGTIFRFSRNTGLVTLYSFTGKTDGAYPKGPILLDDDGHSLYGIAANNINNEQAIFFKLDLDDKVLSPLVSFGKGSQGQAIVPFSIIKGSDGNFYGTTFDQNGVDPSTIFRVTPSGELTTLYTWTEDLGAPTLIQGRDGDLYGITGGYMNSGKKGTIFKLSLSN